MANRQPDAPRAQADLAPASPQSDLRSAGAGAGGSVENVQPDGVLHLRRALAASHKGEQMLASLIESAMDAIVSVDAAQRIVQFNPAAERMFGLAASEAIGAQVEILLPEDARDSHAELIGRFARSGLSHHAVTRPGCMRGRRVNGEVFQAEASISQIDVDGEPLFTIILRDVSKRALHEQALRESEERLALFDATTFEGVVVSDGGRIVDCNEQFARMTGYTVGELVGMRIDELVAPEDRERKLDTIAHGRESVAEYGLLRKDGQCIVVEAHGKTLVPASRAARRVTAVRDITERKRIEQALRERTERYELVLAGAESAIWDLDLTTGDVLFSSRWKAIRGLADDEAGDTLDDWSAGIHPDDVERVNVAVAAHFRGDTPIFAEEYRIRCKDGTTKWISDRGVCRRDADGNVVRMAGSETDITERKRIEQALRDSQADLKRAQSVAQIGSWRLNLQRNELQWSEECARIHGVPECAGPLTSETFFSALHPDDRAQCGEMWMAARAGEPYEVEHRLLVNGRVRWVRKRAELEFDAEGELLGAFGTVQDITALKEAEQALREADQRKNDFLAMLSHELRNPLTPIRNAAHVLSRVASDEPQVQWAQQIITQQVDHVARLVDDLLDVSRIVRGKIVLKPEEVDLIDVVNQVLDAAGPLLAAKHHRLEVGLPDHAVHLRGDRVRLVQMLLNLLDNASKYTPEGGKIRLDVRLVGRVVEIEVRDNGMGIPLELQPRIFELFQQGERTLDRSQGGLGIGLTVVKHLVDLHDGDIIAHSAGPGQGSCFTITLPTQTKAPAHAEPAGEPAADTGVQPVMCRILVVDDDRAVAESTAALLALDGHDVRTAANGAAALELARSFRPHLVLLDIGLQGMDGYEVARRLRVEQAARDERTFVVAVTGYGHEEARRLSEEAGFDRHLVKPVYPEVLSELVLEVGNAYRASGGRGLPS
jgi:PAS domain S-box-containing protein